MACTTGIKAGHSARPPAACHRRTSQNVRSGSIRLGLEKRFPSKWSDFTGAYYIAPTSSFLRSWTAAQNLTLITGRTKSLCWGRCSR